jgi:sugar lactone lactonase YvrE
MRSIFMGFFNTTLRQYRWLRWCLAGITIGFWSLQTWGATGDIITTVAGNGTAGYSGDGYFATDARLNYPLEVALDSNGNHYIADWGNNRIRKVNATTRYISTVAGNGSPIYSGDGGAATSAGVSVGGIALDSRNNLYIGDKANCRIRKIDAATGKISTIAGNGACGYGGDGAAATNAKLGYPTSVALDSSNNLYIADANNNRIRKVDATTGNISTVAGNGTSGYSGDGGAATSATLKNPTGVAIDNSGNLYIADESFHVRKVDATTHNITNVAGNGTWDYSGDGGAATNAQLSAEGIALDSRNNLYIADGNNSRIRRVDATTGNITTVAGNGIRDYSGDGKVATNAKLRRPSSIALDSSGNLYIADEDDARVRRVVLTDSTNQPNLTIDPLLMPLDKNSAQTLTFTVSNLADAAAATLGTPTLNGYYASQFTLNTAASNDCANTTLTAGASCTVSVGYIPASNQGLSHSMIDLNIPDTRGIVQAQALISSGESTSEQAARRLPDVLTSVTVPALTVGNPATITWTMTGYQTDAHSQIALFECTTDGAGNAVSTCGDSYASRTVASDVLSPTTTADGDWTYQNVRAKNRTYSYSYTPTKTGPVVLRFYQKSGIDKAAGNSGTSLLIPGGLNGSGSSFTYFDAEGRRIKATVQ